MNRKIVVSAEARAQLDRLYDYIATAGSPKAALRFVSAILDQLQTLEDFQNIGAPRADILPGLRTLTFRKRVTIAFVVEPAEVLVVGVFYGGQDFEPVLKGE